MQGGCPRKRTGGSARSHEYGRESVPTPPPLEAAAPLRRGAVWEGASRAWGVRKHRDGTPRPPLNLLPGWGGTFRIASTRPATRYTVPIMAMPNLVHVEPRALYRIYVEYDGGARGEVGLIGRTSEGSLRGPALVADNEA